MQRSLLVETLLSGPSLACVLTAWGSQGTAVPTSGARAQLAVAASPTRPGAVPAPESNPTLATKATGRVGSPQVQASTSTPAAPAAPTRTAPPPTETATVTATATPVVPAIIVGQTSNLRVGPGTNYRVVSALHAGEVLRILARDPGGSWWQVPGGWIFAALGTASEAADQAPVAGNIPPAPSPTRTLAPIPSATPNPAGDRGSHAAGTRTATVVLGQDTKYPVQARRVIGWGYELVDASNQYDLIVHRDAYGVMAHKAWESLFQRHQHGIRISLIDPIRLDECWRSWGSNRHWRRSRSAAGTEGVATA